MPSPPPIGLPLPSSWYCLGLAADLPPGGLWRRTVAGQEVVVFRSQAGHVAVLDAYCPHLGADLGVGGQVVGETIRCSFHGFCIGLDGACTSTPYGRKVPPLADGDGPAGAYRKWVRQFYPQARIVAAAP